jgi:hypothetical protein
MELGASLVRIAEVIDSLYVRRLVQVLDHGDEPLGAGVEQVLRLVTARLFAPEGRLLVLFPREHR